MAILQVLRHQFFDSSGNPLSGGKVYTYDAGTSTPRNTYTDQGAGTPNANPVILDSRGEASIWFSGSYKVVLKTSADVTIYTVDNIQESSAGFVTTTGVETLTNKTLTSPAISSPTLSGSAVIDSAAATVIESQLNVKTTVASATTPDIFAATIGRLIDYTGTATATGFVAAPRAGMFRELYCAGACLFTAGANLLIEGIPSGYTITLAAGALVQVRSITTTQFKMTYSVVGSYVLNPTGLTTSPNCTCNYTVANGLVCLSIEINAQGTSNSTSFTLTGMPVQTRPMVTPRYGMVGIGIDNNVATTVNIDIPLSGVITLGKAIGGGLWTATGSKGLQTSEIVYRIA